MSLRVVREAAERAGLRARIHVVIMSLAMTDVLVRGAGWIGLAVAKGLRDAGATVQIVDPRGALAGASGRSVGIALPVHPEHPHRFEAAMGAQAGEVAAFIRASIAELPGFTPTGIRVRVGGDETGEVAEAIAAARRLGYRAVAVGQGYHLADGGTVDLLALSKHLNAPVVAEAGPAEVEVLCTGWEAADDWLADKLMPVRWQAARFAGPPLACPVVSQHMTVRWSEGLVASGARWATSHMEVGETENAPSPTVNAMLARLTGKPVDEIVASWAGIVAESCDGLPIVGPVPGRPRVVACTGFGISGLSYGLAAARSVVDGLCERKGLPVPRVLSTARFL